MFDFLDFFLKSYNPILDIYLFLVQYLNQWLNLALIIFVSTTILIFIFKKIKVLAFALLLPIIYGYFGIFSVMYLSSNYEDSYSITFSKEDLIGDWCKDNDKLTFHSNNTIDTYIDSISNNDTWVISGKKIKINNINIKHNELNPVRFANELFLTFNMTGGNYSDLEYKQCESN